MTNELYPSEWLQGSIDVAEIEAEWLDGPSPYGVPRQDWHRLKEQMRAGDEIRALSSPPDSWKHHAGRLGYALVRDNKVVAAIITMMN